MINIILVNFFHSVTQRLMIPVIDLVNLSLATVYRSKFYHQHAFRSKKFSDNFRSASKPSQTSKTELYGDVCMGSEYSSELCIK